MYPYHNLSFTFPEYSSHSRSRNVNMLPFLLFKPKETLPAELHDYIVMIRSLPIRCRDVSDSSRVAYLTIHESDFEQNATHRRSGLHIERLIHDSSGCVNGRLCQSDDVEFYSLAWGLGNICKEGKDDVPVDGIFMVSDVSDSCAVYPCLVDRPETVTDRHGSLEHFKHYIEKRKIEPRLLKANELCWITDCTPHESLPLATSQRRRFFRVVVGPISVWYSRHNTPNPLVLPQAIVSDVDKFA